MIVAIMVDLPEPLGPMSPLISPLSTLQAHAVERLDAREHLVDVVQLEDGCSHLTAMLTPSALSGACAARGRAGRMSGDRFEDARSSPSAARSR